MEPTGNTDSKYSTYHIEYILYIALYISYIVLSIECGLREKGVRENG